MSGPRFHGVDVSYGTPTIANMPVSSVSTVPRGARMNVRMPDVRSWGPVRMGIFGLGAYSISKIRGARSLTRAWVAMSGLRPEGSSGGAVSTKSMEPMG